MLTVASAVMQALHWTTVGRQELSQKAKNSIHPSVYVPTFTYGPEFWVASETMRPRIQATEMSFFKTVARLGLRDRVSKQSVIWGELRVEPLLLNVDRSQF